MKPQPKFVRVYGERKDGQWTLVCLEFSLAVQSESLNEAKEKLRSQIASYVHEATVGVDSEHRDYLLSRSAPLYCWLKFYFFNAIQVIRDGQKKGRAHIALTRPMSSYLSAA